jgi:phenylalanyl-tRNA synthetase alpha chain
MEQQLKELRQAALTELPQAENLEILNDLRIKYLGKKGSLTAILRGVGALSPEERRG